MFEEIFKELIITSIKLKWFSPEEISVLMLLGTVFSSSLFAFDTDLSSFLSSESFEPGAAN